MFFDRGSFPTHDNRTLDEVQSTVNDLKNQAGEISKNLHSQTNAYQTKILIKQEKISQLSAQKNDLVQSFTRITEQLSQLITAKNDKINTKKTRAIEINTLISKQNEIEELTNILEIEKQKIAKKEADTIWLIETQQHELERCNQYYAENNKIVATHNNDINELKQLISNHLLAIEKNEKDQRALEDKIKENERLLITKNSVLELLISSLPQLEDFPQPPIAKKDVIAPMLQSSTSTKKDQRATYAGLGIFGVIGIAIVISIIVWPSIPLAIGGVMLGAFAVANKAALISVGVATLALGYSLIGAVGLFIKKFKNRNALQPSNKITNGDNKSNDLKSNDNKSRLEANIQAQKHEIQQLQSTITQQKQTFLKEETALQKNKNVLLAEIQRLTHDLDRLNKEVASLEKQLQLTNKQINSLEQEAVLREAVHNKNKEYIAGLEATIKQKQTQLSQAASLPMPVNNDAINQLVNNLKQQLQALDNEVLLIQKQIDVIDNESAEIFRKQSSIHTLIGELKDEIVQDEDKANKDETIIKLKADLANVNEKLSKEQEILNFKQANQENHRSIDQTPRPPK